MKTLTIDCRMINSSGIGTYIQNLIPRVINQLHDLSFNLICDTNELNQLDWTQTPNVQLIHSVASIYSIREQLELILKISRGTDLLWATNYNIPFFYPGKLIVTVHDVAHLVLPEYRRNFLKRNYSNIMFKKVAKKANAIICISKFTASELKKYVDPRLDRKINVIHNGIDNSWFHIKKLNNPFKEPYLLYVGNVKPHKNLSRLVKAFAMLINRIHHNLVIVGKREGFITGDEKVHYMSKNLKDRIKFTGRVTDEELKQYYIHADALIFPSTYEGFGFPPLEAMACGCPTLVSNVASIPEICGDASLYFKPTDVNNVSDRILQFIRNKSQMEMIIKRGIKQARKFSWNSAAEKTIEIINGLLT